MLDRCWLNVIIIYIILFCLYLSYIHISVSRFVVKMDTDEEGDNDWDRSLESDMLETTGGFITGH